MNIKEQIIYKAFQILEEKIDLKGQWFAILKDKMIDGKLELKNTVNRKTFPAIVKKEIKTTHLVGFSEIKQAYPDVIVIAETIFPKIREQLRKMGINYIDIYGNCYIAKNEWVYLVEGFKTDTPVAPRKDSAFTKTSLLLIFHFLNDERYLDVTYRQMAEDYGTALGNINKIINSLKDQGYLLKLNRKDLKLTKRKELLDEWIQAYEQKLKPSLFIGKFRQLNGADKDWEKIPINNVETQWGGEPAGNLLTGYLKPGRLMLYTLEEKQQLIRKYRLVPDENGRLDVYRKFWKFNIAVDTVPPLLVYADLINSGDPRNIETAKMLYHGQLKN